MPKQVINYPGYAEDHPFALALSLHWYDKPTETPNDGPQFSIQFNVDALTEHLNQLRQHSPMDKRSIIFSEPLARDELQMLVRTARRARDSAFGGDE